MSNGFGIHYMYSIRARIRVTYSTLCTKRAGRSHQARITWTDSPIFSLSRRNLARWTLFRFSRTRLPSFAQYFTRKTFSPTFCMRAFYTLQNVEKEPPLSTLLFFFYHFVFILKSSQLCQFVLCFFTSKFKKLEKIYVR